MIEDEKEEIEIYCKRDFYRKNKILFKKGKKYKHYKIYNDESDIFIFYDEYNTDSMCRGYRLYFETDKYRSDNDSLVYDYFYTEEEVIIRKRKEKLKKLARYES